MRYSKVKIARQYKDEVEKTYSQYEVEYDPNKSVLQMLREIFAEEDRSLSFRRYCCNRGVCGSCTMIINGKVKRACVTSMSDEMTIEPLEKYGVIKDLVANID
ncbi:succinate dehydrogenase / fumarate reductase iron-sulfur subunit [Dethiosulfatibacter aminovorans DSM 17477]|uniref:Succinate dehydrogenase / fumarate reductase iron-sulfur subunit n=1 Tax=Dethiosulfatibacter aminovorans DSM 17477 TaxID=1121476 RepID=A0A1M6HVF0_9FIRM|nr:2Fe-2S iron-sulfur cluster-binding protein [Dethiosulfatibacter aminovorans]SHJ26200.1 succinate dehydrogenase / fumarate reductase iron-sulfur subunit [Dethiosulfatibacter aminovorans DSM 17477]